MDRRRFLASVAIAPLLAAVGKPSRAAAQQSRRQQTIQSAARKRPNVLLLMADQHKRSCMGAYGDPVAKTPNLDQLAAGSVRFTSAYCNNPICTPSRARVTAHSRLPEYFFDDRSTG